MSEKIHTDFLIIGAGPSGVATAKCVKQAGFDVVVLERYSDVGGVWGFKEKGHSVMRFTHNNVSKHNYCFSDYPFPEGSTDFPHNDELLAYIRDYVNHFKVRELIHFNREVISVVKKGDEWEVKAVLVKEDDQGTITHTECTQTYIGKNVAVATGHHSKPNWPDFPGQDTYKGDVIHSASYKDAESSGMVGKRVLVVGMGNSAVDVASDVATLGRCKPVYMSSRSGAWVLPYYLFGYPLDLYTCRLFFQLPWRISTIIVESIIKNIYGDPVRWNLNPKMHALQAQPSMSSTLLHHIQRKEIRVLPNIKNISGKTITFDNDTSVEADKLIFCTGYKIDLPFLSDEIRTHILEEDSNIIKLFKNVFSPGIGKSLAFIGFVQPESGGVLAMSEVQARWWAQLCKGQISLPSQQCMEADIQREIEKNQKRYFRSHRHTIQKDQLVYCNEIASYFGAKPQYLKHPWIAWRLLLGSCGAYQYRLQGPDKWEHAEGEVCKVPVPKFIFCCLFMLFFMLLWCFLPFLYWFVDDYLDWDLDWWWD